MRSAPIFVRLSSARPWKCSVKKTLRAARECRAKLVTVSGGVSCNRQLRDQMSEACNRAGLKLLTAAPKLCTDNAAMIAFAASLRLDAGLMSEVTQEIDPNLALAGYSRA